ncbi:MAG: ABC transporter [Verrucomicrobiales bacterium]|nr:ABC transporter [Verrucomicrobiales bacterium]
MLSAIQRSMSATLDRVTTYKDIGVLLMKYLPKISDARKNLTAHFDLPDDIEPSEDAEKFTDDLEDLGPTFVKVGQLLSTRVDLLPPTWTAALQRLQDDVGSIEFEAVREQIESSLGAKITNLFSEFDEEPLASASIGQVHRAILRDKQTEVVVKVQRPGIREKMVEELDAIQRAADFLQDHSEFGEKYDIQPMVAQFRRAIMGELDYLAEGQNLRRLATNLRESPNLIVPLPHDSFTSREVLTMDYIQGAKVTDLSGVVLTEVNGKALAEELFQSYLKQIMIDGFFHADPHPGNLLLTPDHQLALIDLGMVGTVSDDLKDDIIQLLGAISEGKSAEAARVATRMGREKDYFEAEEFASDIKQLVDKHNGSSVKEMQVGNLVMQITETCGKHGLRIPEPVFMIGKMLLNLDMVGAALAPDFNPDESIRHHIADLAERRMRDHLTIGSVVHYLTDIKELFAETPTRLNQVLENLAENKVSVDVNAFDETKLLKGFHRVANRITVGLILAALIVGASMLMQVESNFTLFGYPGLAMIFFLIAAVGGLSLVGSILFSSEKD